MSLAVPKSEGMAETESAPNGTPGEVTVNGLVAELIDEDIQHTVGRLLQVRAQHGGKGRPLDSALSRALQAERNHWKERLQAALHEIDRQHRILLAAEAGLQELVASLCNTRQRNAILEEEEEEEGADQGRGMSRLLEQLKFQVRQVKLRGAGLHDASRTDLEETQLRQKQDIKEFKETIRGLEAEKKQLEAELTQKDDKIKWLKKDNASLHKQLKKFQAITERYNEKHSGSNFHLKIVESGKDKHASVSTLDLHENSISTVRESTVRDSTVRDSTVRERTYVEGDQMGSYPDPNEENAIIKDRLKKNIYSARKGDLRSSNVAQCLRCQTLFRPPENNHRACRFHHKGREITEQFDGNGKLDKVLYKWACCKKALDAPGCCFGYHV